MSETAELPRVNPLALELAVAGRTWATFQLRTPHTIAEVSAPGYFDSGLSSGFRQGDVINVLAEGGPEPVYAQLAIARIGSANENPRVRTRTI